MTNSARRLGQLLLAAGVCLGLASCGSGKDLDDLRGYVEQVKQRSKTKVEPLPKAAEFEVVQYTAGASPDPFLPIMEKQKLARAATSTGPTPDTQRKREPLEQYPLDSLRMKGSMQRDGELWAIIGSSDGIVHRAKVGNFIGQNFGKVVRINENKIDLRETISDGMGGWEERDTSLTLSN